MEKKRNWEIQYEKYKSPETQARFNELKSKFESKTITREENEEYQKMIKIMGNLPKVDNIMEYMDKLESDLDILKEEYMTRKKEIQKEKDISDLDKEINANLKRQEELLEKKKENEKKIGQSKDNDEIVKLQKENEDIDGELSKLKYQAGENNKKFAELHNPNSPNQVGKRKESLAKYSDEDLRAKCFETSAMLSKCNLVARNLMNGLSIASIQVKLEGWKNRKFTSKDSLPLSKKEKAARQQVLQTRAQQKGQTTQGTRAQSATPSQVPANVNEFEKAFPRLAKRFPNMKDNFLGKMLLKIKSHLPSRNKEESDTNKTTVLPTNGNIPQTHIQTSQQNKKEMFKNYVKYDVLEVADKGLEGVEKEKREAIKKRQEEMRPQYEEQSRKLKEEQMEARKKSEEEER